MKYHNEIIKPRIPDQYPVSTLPYGFVRPSEPDPVREIGQVSWKPVGKKATLHAFTEKGALCNSKFKPSRGRGRECVRCRVLVDRYGNRGRTNENQPTKGKT